MYSIHHDFGELKIKVHVDNIDKMILALSLFIVSLSLISFCIIMIIRRPSIV